MGARDQKLESKDPNPGGYVEPAPSQLAEGTRRDIDAQRTKGICVATHCRDIDQFVAQFYRYCEKAAIFIPNARRTVGATLPFSFELADEESVLVGVGNVIEEFTTVHNRFGRAGIVISVQKLKRESIAVFEKLLAARKNAVPDRHTPPPIFARSVTGPIPLEDVRKALRNPTRPPTLEVKIPSPTDKPIAKPRANTVLGLPTITKAPARQSVMQIPAIVPPSRADAKGSRTYRVPDATPRPIYDGPDTFVDAIPDEQTDVAAADTVRDEVPFALRNELRLLEQRATVAKPVEPAAVDDGWDVETPAATLGALPIPETILQEAISEPVAAPVMQPEPVPATLVDPFPLAVQDEHAIPIALPMVASDAATAPKASAIVDVPTPIEEPEPPTGYPWWSHALRWMGRVAIASTLFCASAAITASIDAPSLPLASDELPALASPVPPPANALVPTETTPACFEQEQDQAAVAQQPATHRATPAPTKPQPAGAAPKRVAPPTASEPCTTLDCL